MSLARIGLAEPGAVLLIEPHTAGGGLGFLTGGGELGALIREFHWAATPLGTPDCWPQNLRMALRIMLASRQPMWIGWGSQLTYFYNDPYKSIIGGKHPWALGRPTSEVWREIWGDIGPMLDTAMHGDQGTYVEAQLLIMERNGYPEETYYTFSYSPIPNGDGSVGGIICANSDDTQRVIGERQLALLRDLGTSMAHTRSRAEICVRAASQLAANGRDLPFACIYLPDEEGSTYRLEAAHGIEAGHPAAPGLLALGQPSSWPVAEALAAHSLQVVADLRTRFNEGVPRGPWPQAPDKAAVLPFGEGDRAGVLIVGLNPFRLFDEGYQSFLQLVAGQIAAAIANAQAYEEERLRAEALAQIDRAKMQFFSNVSHEFRTPLTLMLGPLEDALNDRAESLSASQRDRVQTAHRNSLRLLRLVNTLLDFSRMEAGRAEASFLPVNLAKYTAELAATFQSAIERANLRLIVHCPALSEDVYVDPDMWEKIVLNLLSNAFKFTFEGEISVEMAPSHDGKSAVLSVRDSGVGIAQDELPRLFERFHRVEGQRSRSFEGSGIGLALVQELVKFHGGTITVESQIGHGSVFRVSIPFGTGHLPQHRVQAARSRVSTSTRAEAYIEEVLRWLPDSASGLRESVSMRPDDEPQMPLGRKSGGARILVADDNADMRSYVGRLLGSRWQVETVTDGEAALKFMRSEKTDLLLSDVMMPGLDGFGLLREVRSDPKLRHVPVILLSARAGEDARVEGLDAGADDYLTKPFSARELLARVNVNLEMARVRRETEQILQESNDLLARRVDAAVAERAEAEAQLRQAQKMEAVGRLTGGIAHDFNNVLQVISGNLQLLSRDISGNLRGEQRLTTAIAALGRGSKLASQLLAFGRRQPLAPKVVNLGRLIRGTSDMLQRALGEGIEVETIIGGGLWHTFVDAAQVENALLNLAINSRDAMKGHGKLTIEAGNASLDDAYAALHREVIPGQYVMLAVTDTGAGIAPELIDKVFEPFFTTKPEGQGTGLGLSMVYGFVKQSGGHINIYSEVAQGTTVRIYLPRSRQSEDVAAEVEVDAVSGGTEVVLVVEDDDDVRSTVVDMLSELGYRVLKARDAQSALAIVESGIPIDLIFTDVVMPGQLRSPELAVKARQRIPTVAVLFTSGYTDNAIVHGGRLDDGIDLLSKPYTRDALARKVRQILRSQQQRNGWGSRHP